MIYETEIGTEFEGIGYAEFKAQFEVTYDPARYSDEQDDCSAEFLPLRCGEVTLTRDMLIGMTCKAYVERIERHVAEEWYDRGGPSDMAATRVEEHALAAT